MISALACMGGRSEKELMLSTLRDLAARLSEDEWRIEGCETAGEADRFLQSAPLVDLACCSVSDAETLAWVERFRKAYRDSRLMLIADARISPVRYLRPQIMASSLLLRPYSRKQLSEVTEDFIRACLEAGEDESKCLVIRDRDGKLLVPYSKIYYLEAREKKIFVRLLREEYALYETLENIRQALPGYFARTHRSFIVNTRMIERVRVSEHLVSLRDGLAAPLSRGFRGELKEFGL